ncbi:RAB3A interacting protein [Mortierella sp. GBA35]|nr:RAB3A interacting protein [Mortierella sp. AD031]KAF9106346.1 RAB3A interacting protein [Mortierella sp. GBA35]KAG0207892.1 RAB3A interacting protein [Mortierella sp. NVP41]
MEQVNTEAQVHLPADTEATDTETDATATTTPATTTATTPTHLNNGDTAQQEDPKCLCHKVLTDASSSACGICERIIPSLDESRREHTRLVKEMEQAQVRLAEEKKRALEATVDVEVLRKKIEDLEDSLQAKSDDYEGVQKDLAILNDKYVYEIEKVAELQHAKETVEGELEELSRTLFEEANGMVATEARARHQLELTRKHLELELKDAQERLAAETSQLKELKSKMETMMESQPQSRRSSANHSDRGSVDLAQLFGINNRISVPEALVEEPEPEPETAIAIDGQLLQEFREFVTQSSSVRLNKIHSLTFMRHCQDEDVEPCLRFGNTPRITAKKLTEGICSNTCYIEEATAEQVKEYERMVLAAQQPPSPARNSMSSKSVLWERLQNQYAMYQAPKGGCQTCGRSGPLSHRYRIASLDEWSFIDRFCRDRLVAVCEFYIFIRNIRAGLYATRTIEDLYSESLRLRLQMFYARSGVLPIMLSELGTTAQSIGNMGSAGQGQWPEGTPPLRGESSDAGSINSASASALTTPISTPKTERAEL